MATQVSLTPIVLLMASQMLFMININIIYDSVDTVYDVTNPIMTSLSRTLIYVASFEGETSKLQQHLFQPQLGCPGLSRCSCTELE